MREELVKLSDSYQKNKTKELEQKLKEQFLNIIFAEIILAKMKAEAHYEFENEWFLRSGSIVNNLLNEFLPLEVRLLITAQKNNRKYC